MRAAHICWHISVLGCLVVVLLRMIDCSQNGAVIGGRDSTSSKQATGSNFSGSKHIAPGLRTKLRPTRQQQQAGINQSLAPPRVLMKRSAPSLGRSRTDSDHQDDTLISEPAEINEVQVKSVSQSASRPSTSQTVVTNSATVAVLPSVAAKMNETSRQTARRELANSESASDSSQHAEARENDCNLLDKLKSFFETVSEKIILCVNNLKSDRKEVELDNVNSDQETSLEGRRGRRLSKSQIMQIIIDDFNLGTDAANHDNKNTSERANEILAADDNNHTNKARSVAGQPNGVASNQGRASEARSISDMFRDRLNSMLDDDKVVVLQHDDSDTITIDLDLLKLQKRESAQSHSFPPIEQLKKVMNFMHFG